MSVKKTSPSSEKLTEQGNDWESRDKGELVPNRIYVGGLGDQIVDRDLFYYFSEFGEVSHVGIITGGGYSKGYGFVTFQYQQTVKNLLEGPDGEKLVLKGRRLNIGPARQRQGQGQGWRRQDGYNQGLRRLDENYNLTKDNTEERVKTPHLSPDQAEVDSSQQELSPTFNQYLPGDSSYTYDSVAQPLCCTQGSLDPMYPYSQYYPLQQGAEYQQYPVYPQPMPVWYSSSYQDTSNPCSTFTTPSPIYPLAYPASQEVPYPAFVPTLPAEQLPSPSTGPCWPQTPAYPVFYNYNMPSMVQYSYTGEGHQPVPGFQEYVVQDNSGYLDTSGNAPHTFDYQNSTNPSCADNTVRSYSEASQLADSGYQDTTCGYEDQSTYKYQQSAPAPDNQGSAGNIEQQVAKSTPKTSPQGKSTLNAKLIGVASPEVATSQQEQERFTKVKPTPGNKWNVPRNTGDEPFVTNRPARDGRFYPSPYKSFSPYTGNPSPRHFPFPSGPRPYYSGQGQNRGRGRIWGQNSGGNMGEGGRNIQKKKHGKKEAGRDKKATEKEGPEVSGKDDANPGIKGTQPDLLQIPLKNLMIK